MTEEPDSNPYQSPGLLPSSGNRQLTQQCLKWFIGGVCGYYIVSALTLPFANKVWLGEVPIFGLIQFPKALLKSLIHEVLLKAIVEVGWSSGTASPDYGMTHPFAMILMCLLPGGILISSLLISGLARLRPAMVFIMCMAVDAAVTLMYDSSSGLKLYAGVFF